MSDLINALFESFGFVAIGLSCLRVMKDKQVHGISVLTVAFFTSWGFWNLYYYPSFGQTLSGEGAALTCLANCFWIYLIMKYRTKP